MKYMNDKNTLLWNPPILLEKAFHIGQSLVFSLSFKEGLDSFKALDQKDR